MRRIDVIGIGIGVFAAGGIAYLMLVGLGLNTQNAGLWSQVMLVVGLLGWVSTYLFRVFTKNMTYHQQRRDYEEAAFQKRWEEMTPEQRAELQAQVEQEASSD